MDRASEDVYLVIRARVIRSQLGSTNSGVVEEVEMEKRERGGRFISFFSVIGAYRVGF